MSTNDTNQQNCSGRIESAEQITADLVDAMDVPDAVADQFTDLVGCMADEISELRDENADLQNENEELQDRVDELESRPEVDIDDESDPVGSFTIADAPVGRVLTAKADKSDVEYVEEELEELDTPEVDTETGPVADLTPAEQLARGGDPGEVTDSPSVERAIALFKNLPEWGSKTPKGMVLRPADNPLSLLEADRDESLSWKQYYRAAETLEELTKGAVTFFDSDKHGKMLVLHERSEAYDRVSNASLTTSSVGAKG